MLHVLRYIKIRSFWYIYIHISELRSFYFNQWGYILKKIVDFCIVWKVKNVFFIQYLWNILYIFPTKSPNKNINLIHKLCPWIEILAFYNILGHRFHIICHNKIHFIYISKSLFKHILYLGNCWKHNTNIRNKAFYITT